MVPQLTSVMDEEGELPPAANQPPATPAASPPPATPAANQAPAAAAVDAKSLQDRLKSLLVRQKELFEKNPALRDELLAFSRPASALVLKGSAEASAALDKLEQALNAAERSGPSATKSAPPVGLPLPIDRWNAARAAAAAQIQKVIQLVVETKDPEVGKAELELKAVLRQLNAKLENQQQAAEMERYLHDDDVVADVSELASDLKTPLLNVLAEIKSQLPA